MTKRFVLIAFYLLISFSAAFNIYCLINSGMGTGRPEPKDETEEADEYIYVAVFKDDPMIINHDVKGMNQFAEEYGAKVQIMAPEKYNVEEQKKLLIEAINKKPDGILVCVTDPSFIPYINMAVEQGIPILTVDVDFPDSERLAFVGSDWFDIGVRQAEAMVRLIGGKGIVAMIGMGELVNMQEAYDGYRSVMENYSDIVVLEEFDDQSNSELAKELTKKMLEDYPDIAGISGFDSNSGPGIAAALEELGRIGDLKVTCVDIAEAHLELVKSGAVQKLVGQKRELFTYYGLQLLYNYNRSALTATEENPGMKALLIPETVDTGIIEVDSSNIDEIIY